MAALRDMSNVRKNMKKIERRGSQVSDKGASRPPTPPSPDAFGTSLGVTPPLRHGPAPPSSLPVTLPLLRPYHPLIDI